MPVILYDLNQVQYCDWFFVPQEICDRGNQGGLWVMSITSQAAQQANNETMKEFGTRRLFVIITGTEFVLVEQQFV